MATVDKFKIAEKSPDKIMLADVYRPDPEYKYDFTTWVDTGNAVMEISENKVKIFKFKPNVLLLHSPDKLKGDNCKDICSYCRGNIITVSGLSGKENIFNSYFNTSTTTGAGSDVGKCKGLCFYPYAHDGLFFTCHLNYWANQGIDKDGNQTLGQLPDMVFAGGLRLDGNGRNRYGIFKDYTNKLIFPDELYGFINVQGYSYYYGIGLFTGDTSLADEDGYIDISSSPIIIELFDFGLFTKGIDPSSVEVWEMHIDNDAIYAKDKTLENCLKEYKLATDTKTITDVNTGQTSIINLGYTSIKNLNTDISDIKLPLIVDLENQFKNVCWNIIIRNVEFWEIVRQWYANNNIDGNMVARPLFANSNIGGAIDFRVNITYDENEIPHPFLFVNKPFENSNIEQVNLITDIGCVFSSPHDMFKGAKKMTTITCATPKSYMCGAVDVSGMFAFCSKLTTYPNNLICWNKNRGNSKANGIACNFASWFCDYATELMSIPAYGEVREYDANTIILAKESQQVFNGCNNLVYIGPILNMILVTPSTAKWIFSNCGKLTNVRILNLNHGNWDFCGRNKGDAVHGNIPNLNRESIIFLFNNLMDLTKHNPNVHEDNINKSFSKWNSKYWNNNSIDDNTNYEAKLNSNEILIRKRVTKQTAANYIIYTSENLTDFSFKVTGLSEGDILMFNNTEITIDDIYVFKDSNGFLGNFTLINQNTEINDIVTIEIINGVDHTNPKVSSAILNIPNAWTKFITQSMIDSARAKGWNLYVEDVLFTESNVDEIEYGTWNINVSPDIGTSTYPTYFSSELVLTIEATRTNIINGKEEIETVSTFNNIYKSRSTNAEFYYIITGEGAEYVDISTETGELTLIPNGDPNSYEKDIYVAVYNNVYPELNTQWNLRITYNG